MSWWLLYFIRLGGTKKLSNVTLEKLYKGTAAFWDKYAPWYELWKNHNRYHERLFNKLIKDIKYGSSILDIGGGSGVLALKLARQSKKVMVIEWAGAFYPAFFSQSAIPCGLHC